LLNQIQPGWSKGEIEIDRVNSGQVKLGPCCTSTSSLHLVGGYVKLNLVDPMLGWTELTQAQVVLSQGMSTFINLC